MTYVLIGANLAMFALELAEGAGLGGPTVEQAIDLGANVAALTWEGQPWRLLTAMFLHQGVVHLGMNMLCLYQIQVVERMVGRLAFVALYFASGLLGGVASAITHPHSVCLGASGAVFGMFGAFAATMVVLRDRVEPQAWRRTMRSLGTFFGLNLLIGLTQPGIDLSAHIAGLVVGFAGAFALAKIRRRRAGHVPER